MIYFIVSIFIFLIISVFIALNFSKNDIKGKFGEFYVSSILRIFLDRRYRVLNDIKLSRPGKTSTQIDHIVIGPTGIFVVETKNMKGEIVGRTQNPYWAQIFSMLDRRSFLSPIIQNDIHVNALKHILPSLRWKIFNCVVFVNNASIDLDKDLRVFNVFALINHIRTSKYVLKPDEVRVCESAILANNRL